MTTQQQRAATSPRRPETHLPDEPEILEGESPLSTRAHTTPAWQNSPNQLELRARLNGPSPSHSLRVPVELAIYATLLYLLLCSALADAGNRNWDWTGLSNSVDCTQCVPEGGVGGEQETVERVVGFLGLGGYFRYPTAVEILVYHVGNSVQHAPGTHSAR